MPGDVNGWTNARLLIDPTTLARHLQYCDNYEGFPATAHYTPTHITLTPACTREQTDKKANAFWALDIDELTLKGTVFCLSPTAVMLM
jgi:hypothetical protein